MSHKNRAVLLITLCVILVVTGCDRQAEMATQPMAETGVSSTHEPLVSAPSLEASLKDPGRASSDQARDAGRKPAEIMDFLGVNSGMTVIDLLAAGGYYTEVLSLAVGDTGRVYAHNNEFLLKMRDGVNDKAMVQRLAENRLSNVVRLDREFSDLGLEESSVDVAITALNFHDIYNNGGTDAAQAVLAAVKTILKPGGVLGIIDHVGLAGAENSKLHRIDPDLVRQEARKAGFEIDAESDLLANAEDKHDANVFGELRGKTDRLVIRLRKPAE